MRHVLGPSRDAALAARLPSLSAVSARLRERLAGRDRPARFTVHPDEPAILERLRALDLDL